MGYVIFGGGRISSGGDSGGSGDGGNTPTGIEIGTLAVGSSVFMNVNGTAREFLVVNQGIPSNSSLYDSSCNGTWLLMKNIYENKIWDSSSAWQYGGTTINSYLNNEFLSLFDSDVQSIIKTIKLGSYLGSVVTFETQIFLLSGEELGWTNNNNTELSSNAIPLSYFAECTNDKRIAYLSGETASHWWTRSLGTSSDETRAIYVLASGSHANYPVTSARGIRPALILPSTTLVDENTMEVKGG